MEYFYLVLHYILHIIRWLVVVRTFNPGLPHIHPPVGLYHNKWASLEIFCRQHGVIPTDATVQFMAHH